VVVMKNKVVLVVDDEVEMLTFLELLLRREGDIVIKAQDAWSALHLIKSLTPNLFILDVMMGDMNGFELCKEIRTHAQTSQTPVIILSAWGDSKSLDKALQAGANTFVSKAALPNALMEEIREVLKAERKPESFPRARPAEGWSQSDNQA
jgi:DNA-binding response OmpR family regulator